MQDLSNENIIHFKNNDVEYIQFRKLLENTNICHAFTCKGNGDFDFSEYSPNLIDNYKKICESLKVDYKNIIKPHQTHTDNIVCIEEKTSDNIEIYPGYLENVDGLITNKPNIIFSTLYADCTPIYLYDTKEKVIAIIHSGWQGTVKKIGSKAVNIMKNKYGSKAENILCFIGPTIRRCHFEVEDDVKNRFIESFGNDENMILNHPKEGKYYIDTVYANTKELLKQGIKKENIIDSKICTVCNKDRFFSYRGNTRETGRMTAIIGLKE